MNPREAYRYARDHGQSKKTRESACKDPQYACWYAEDIDKEPREDTRNAACKHPWHAYQYAL